MYEVKDKVTYYMVDRREGKTYFIGNFDDLIRELARHIRFENIVDMGLHDPREIAKTLYAEWDFSGGDTYWGKEKKLVFGLTKVWDKEKHDYVFKRAWHYIYVDVKWTRPYMIIDDCGKVIDFRPWEDKIKERRNRHTNYDLRCENAEIGEKFYRWYYSRHGSGIYFYRSSPVPHTGFKRRGWSNIHKGLLNTLRNAELIRPKARIDWDYWDKYKHTDKSWKTNTKCRHQWEKNL